MSDPLSNDELKAKLNEWGKEIQADFDHPDARLSKVSLVVTKNGVSITIQRDALPKEKKE